MDLSIKIAFSLLEQQFGEKALSILRESLNIGRIKAYFQDLERTGPFNEVHTLFWIERTDEEFQNILKTGVTIVDLESDDGRRVRRDMAVDLKYQAIKELTEVAPVATNSDLQTVERTLGRKPGPKPKYDPEAIWAAAAIIAAKDDIPNSQDEFIFKIEKWFVESFPECGGPPSRGVIQKVVQKLVYLHTGQRTASQLFFVKEQRAENTRRRAYNHLKKSDKI